MTGIPGVFSAHRLTCMLDGRKKARKLCEAGVYEVRSKSFCPQALKDLATFQVCSDGWNIQKIGVKNGRVAFVVGIMTQSSWSTL
jgi:hypothetical protein